MAGLDAMKQDEAMPNDTSALSALDAPSPTVDLTDVQSRKDIFNRAVQRILEQRNSLQAPITQTPLGAFGSSMLHGGTLPERFANGMDAEVEAQAKQQAGQQALTQQRSGLDLKAQMAQILGGGGPGSVADAAQIAAIGGDDKGADSLIKLQTLEQGKYLPIKDAFGNVSSAINTKTGEIISPGGTNVNGANKTITNDAPSDDPQEAAQQILDEQGTPFTPVATRQDITGRNAQAKAYRDSANAAKGVKQQLDVLDAQTGKYRPGKMAAGGYGLESSFGMGGEGVTARTEADKASKALANQFMQANVGAKGSGIRMVEFDAGAVPNADMTDEARSNLVKTNKAIADSQIQRAAISDLYPRMHVSNVNAIMDNYEAKNPPLLQDGTPNPKWMTYKDWLSAGRPNTAQLAVKGDSGSNTPSLPTPEQARTILAARRAKK